MKQKNEKSPYQPLSGQWMGAGATEDSGELNPNIGFYFPAGGTRNPFDGTMLNVGSFGYLWPGSSYSASPSYSYHIAVNSSSVPRSANLRQFAFPVRCIRVN